MEGVLRFDPLALPANVDDLPPLVWAARVLDLPAIEQAYIAADKRAQAIGEIHRAAQDASDEHDALVHEMRTAAFEHVRAAKPWAPRESDLTALQRVRLLRDAYRLALGISTTRPNGARMSGQTAEQSAVNAAEDMGIEGAVQVVDLAATLQAIHEVARAAGRAEPNYPTPDQISVLVSAGRAGWLHDSAAADEDKRAIVASIKDARAWGAQLRAVLEDDMRIAA